MRLVSRFCLCVAAAISLQFSLQAAPTAANPLQESLTGRELTVRTTAYTASENNGGGFSSAIGTRLKHHGEILSAASDWSWLPVGTVFRIKQTGATYRIEDYGSALVGRKTIDLYMPNSRMMNAWGVQKSAIEIVEIGSFEKSLDLLEGRTRSPHVRRMVTALREQKRNQVLIAATKVMAE